MYNPHFLVDLAPQSVLCLLISLATVLLVRKTRPAFDIRCLPPIVKITEQQLTECPRQAYEHAVRTFGPIVRVFRRGQWEYILSREFARQMFSDTKTFSFEDGMCQMLHLHWLKRLHGGSFFADMDTIVNEGIIGRLDEIIRQISPVFRASAERLVKDTSKKPIEMFAYTQDVISEAMILIIFGKAYNDERTKRVVIDTGNGVAQMAGLYQNTSWLGRRFPLVWQWTTWCRVMFFVVGYKFFLYLGPKVWTDITRAEDDLRSGRLEQKDSDDVSLIVFLTKKYVNADGQVPVGSRLWILCLLAATVFASVHQTASAVVWVVYELAKRPEYLATIREELTTVQDESGSDGANTFVTYEALRNAKYLDSFIREVMRMKQDLILTCRLTTEDTKLGSYVIPKGNIVAPLATLIHQCEEYHGDTANEFKGFRWVDMDKPAAMTSTSYISFGMGRWACPGRVLAVSEIKMIVLSMISIATPSLVGGDYIVADKINTTSVPPEGRLLLNPLDSPLA